MEDSFANELYAESLQLSKIELGSHPTANDSDSNLDGGLDEDGSWCDDDDEERAKDSSLDREWQTRHEQFHTIGYRDGLLAAKDAIAQEGFNAGFKQSVLVGYNWGLVRGVTSAFSYLPNELKEKLIGTQGKRDKLQGLYESVYSLSTTDALKLYHDDLLAKKAREQGGIAEAGCSIDGLEKEGSACGQLEIYSGELQSLLHECPAIESHVSVK